MTASRDETVVATRPHLFPNRSATRWRVKPYHDRFLSEVVEHEHGSLLTAATEADLHAHLRGRLP